MAILNFLNSVDNVPNFQPDRDIPDLKGKGILVTGGNSGMGKETVHQLAKHGPKRIYLAARSKAKYEAAVGDSNAAFLELDLASFASIKRAGDQVKSEIDRLDILVNNAGIMAVPHGLIEDGYELQFGTNHMGHALLTRLLLPLMNDGGRIVNVSSMGHLLVNQLKLNEVKTKMESERVPILYAQSKLANVLHARELARRYPHITSVSVHPGRVETNITVAIFSAWSIQSFIQRIFDTLAGILSVEEGALCQIWAASCEDEAIQNGGYYVPVGKLDAGSKVSRDEAMAKELWEWQEAELERLGY